MPNNNNYYSTEKHLESTLKENINFLKVIEDYYNWTKYSEKYHFRIMLYGSLLIWILNFLSIFNYSRDYSFQDIYKALYLIGILIPIIILLYSLQTIYLKYTMEKLRNDNIILKQFLDRAKRDKYFDQKELAKLLARIGENHKKLEKTYSNLLENLPKNLIAKPTTTREILDINRSLKDLITKAISTVLGRRKIDDESNQTIKSLTSKNRRNKTNKINKTSKLGKLGSLRRSLRSSRERNTRLREKTKDSRMLERKMRETEIFKNDPDKLKSIINMINNESEKKRSSMENRMLESKNKEQKISNIQEYTQIVKNVNEKVTIYQNNLNNANKAFDRLFNKERTLEQIIGLESIARKLITNLEEHKTDTVEQNKLNDSVKISEEKSKEPLTELIKNDLEEEIISDNNFKNVRFY